MRRFIYITVLTTVFTSTVLSAFAQAPFSKASAVIHSAAYPNQAKVTSATYHVGIQVGRSSLSEIRLIVPENAPGKIRMGQIAVSDATGQLIKANRSFNGKEVTIAFAQPVAVGTMLEIDLNGVRTSDLLGRTWLFPIYGRSDGMNQEIPLGTARIQTYQ
ncbi:MAG: DUF2808 domain-containing protein [Myxacorys chilensis ATA2-1-KO14]|nr:DUF2808 domain-containing protein [Myxacorys chilensis ATA2-1-KO14]